MITKQPNMLCNLSSPIRYLLHYRCESEYVEKCHEVWAPVTFVPIFHLKNSKPGHLSYWRFVWGCCCVHKLCGIVFYSTLFVGHACATFTLQRYKTNGRSPHLTTNLILNLLLCSAPTPTTTDPVGKFATSGALGAEIRDDRGNIKYLGRRI